MEIKGEDYTVLYDADHQVVTLKGVMRLHGNDYNDIVKVFHSIVVEKPDTVTLDLRQLEFLNSSGINHLFKFAVNLRNQAHTNLIVKGSSEIPWQQKSLKNLRTLMRKAEIQWS